MKLPPTILIRDTDFHSSWARAVRHILLNGIDLVIGDPEEPKSIRDSCGIIELTGEAIRQIENREIHSDFPFRHIDQYCNEYTTRWLYHNRDAPDMEKFDYTYIERLKMYEVPSEFVGMVATVDQIDGMRRGLRDSIESGISSNRCQAITWYPSIDGGVSPPDSEKAKPCLQSIFIRYLGDHQVEVHWHFRSRDLWGAWQANIVALVDMLNREVIHPNNCKIIKIVDYSDSLHIYQSDVSAAENVCLVSVCPTNR